MKIKYSKAYLNRYGDSIIQKHFLKITEAIRDGMYREYTSVPQKRLALQIYEDAKIEKLKSGRYKVTQKSGAISEVEEFDASKKPAPGDYVVKIKKGDIYHVDKETFEKSYRSTGFQLL